MQQEKNKDAVIEQILQSLDGVQRATAPDFLHTRLRVRIEAQNIPFVPRPVLVLSALILMLVMNLFVLLRGTQDTQKHLQPTESDEMQMADAYGFNDVSAFTNESNENK